MRYLSLIFLLAAFGCASSSTVVQKAEPDVNPQDALQVIMVTNFSRGKVPANWTPAPTNTTFIYPSYLTNWPRYLRYTTNLSNPQWVRIAGPFTGPATNTYELPETNMQGYLQLEFITN